MTNSNPFTLFGINREDQKVFYTGRAGDFWASANEAEAFTFATYEHAKRKADLFNKYTELHGIHWIADNGQ